VIHSHGRRFRRRRGRHAGGFGAVTMEDRSIDSGGVSDPLFAVWARKVAE
jgi:hypothetical protein